MNILTAMIISEKTMDPQLSILIDDDGIFKKFKIKVSYEFLQEMSRWTKEEGDEYIMGICKDDKNSKILSDQEVYDNYPEFKKQVLPYLRDKKIDDLFDTFGG